MDDEGIKQIGKNLWAVRVKRISAATGKTVNRKATVGGSKADARRKRDELRAELASTQAARPRTQLRPYATSWLGRRADDPETKATTVRKYGYGLQHILPVLGDLYLDAIAPADIERYVAIRMRQVGIKGGNTVLNELRLLRTLAHDAHRNGYCNRVWTDGVRPPKVREYDETRPNLLTGEQCDRLLAAIPPQWRALVLFLVTTGLRFGEASALHWEDVSAGQATIRYTNDRGRLTTVKTHKSLRRVPMLPVVMELLTVKSSGLVFPSRRGTLHKGSPLKKVLDKACAAVFGPGGLRVTAHGMRRTFNNEGRLVASTLVLQSITGHSTDAMTAHYSMVGAEEKAAVSRAVAERIGAVEGAARKGPEQVN